MTRIAVFESFSAHFALALALVCLPIHAQTVSVEPTPQIPVISSLQLTPAAASQLEHAVNANDNIQAEKILLSEIQRDPHSMRASRLLAYAGIVYFRNKDYLNAAIAWKKSAAISPLDLPLRFSLAMAYVQMNQPGWARQELEALAAQNPKEALYSYWLGRLDYDGHLYTNAIHQFQHAIELDPQMARAYDNLGLCFFYQNQNELALANYEKAIELDKSSQRPSAWPYLNIAVTQQFLNRLPEAEKSLREALRLDPNFAKAHFQLGTVLEDLERPEEALKELEESARLDPAYAEPHIALARILKKLGREKEAREQVQTYLQLHPHSAP